MCKCRTQEFGECTVIRIVNRRNAAAPAEGVLRVYVGRPSELGNPFRIGQHGTREEVIERYHTWLIRDPRANNARKELVRLSELDKAGTKIEIECWCSPMSCHAEIIKEFIIKLRGMEEAAS